VFMTTNSASANNTSDVSEKNDILRREFGVEIRVTPERGRHLIACKQFSPGSTIYYADPYAAVLKTKYVTSRCSECFKSPEEGSSLYRCSRCQWARYCSETCQRRGWFAGHKEECPLLSKAATLNPTETILIVSKILRKKKREMQLPSTTKLPLGQRYTDIEFLLSHRKDFSEERIIELGQLVVKFASFLQLPEGDPPVSASELIELLCKLLCNVFTISDSELKPIGIGLYPIAALINHSCSPNCVVLFDGPKAIIKALQTISLGEEVTINYIELAATLSERQKELKEYFCFECECSKCKDVHFNLSLEAFRCPRGGECSGLVDPLSSLLECNKCHSSWRDPNVKMDVLSQYQQALSLLATTSVVIPPQIARRQLGLEEPTADEKQPKEKSKSMTPMEEYQKLEACVKSLEQILSMYHILLFRSYERLLKLSGALGRWEDALKWCQKTLPFYEYYYSPLYPLKGLQYFALGKIEWYLQHTKEALDAFRLAHSIISLTHPTMDPLRLQLQQMLQNAQLEMQQKTQLKFYNNP
jgi:SET and MYND domain-containing protein